MTPKHSKILRTGEQKLKGDLVQKRTSEVMDWSQDMSGREKYWNMTCDSLVVIEVKELWRFW